MQKRRQKIWLISAIPHSHGRSVIKSIWRISIWWSIIKLSCYFTPCHKISIIMETVNFRINKFITWIFVNCYFTTRKKVPWRRRWLGIRRRWKTIIVALENIFINLKIKKLNKLPSEMKDYICRIHQDLEVEKNVDVDKCQSKDDEQFQTYHQRLL